MRDITRSYKDAAILIIICHENISKKLVEAKKETDPRPDLCIKKSLEI